MISQVFRILIDDHLTPFLKQKTGDDQIFVIPANISEINESNQEKITGKIIMSLVNIEEDRTNNVNDTRYRKDLTDRRPPVANMRPPVYINLYILFASNFENEIKGEKYLNGLHLISQIVSFFQSQNVFNPENSPNLKAHDIEELIFELRSLTFPDLNNLWGILGSKYMPSVLYKVRLLTINEQQAQGVTPFIHKFSVDEVTLKS